MINKLIILFFCVISNYSFSQDTVSIEGILIQRYLKKETLIRLENNILKKQGKSFQQMIDYKVQLFYFTTKIDSTISLLNENDIEQMITSYQNYKNVEVYKFPNNLFKALSQEYQYYTNSKDAKYVYKIYHIKGNAVRYEIKNDYLNKQNCIDLEVKWNVNSFNMNKNIPSFYLYDFFRINAIDSSFSIKGFDIWARKLNN